MTKVPLNCWACGVDFQLYHDGTEGQLVVVTCVCGEQTRWQYPTPQPCSSWSSW